MNQGSPTPLDPSVFRTLHLRKGNELTWKSELKLLVTLKASKEQKNNLPSESVSAALGCWGGWAAAATLQKLKSPSDITCARGLAFNGLGITLEK